MPSGGLFEFFVSFACAAQAKHEIVLCEREKIFVAEFIALLDWFSFEACPCDGNWDGGKFNGLSEFFGEGVATADDTFYREHVQVVVQPLEVAPDHLDATCCRIEKFIAIVGERADGKLFGDEAFKFVCKLFRRHIWLRGEFDEGVEFGT